MKRLFVVALLVAFAGPVVAGDSDTHSESYQLPPNIFLPEMPFLVVKESDSVDTRRCKIQAYNIVDAFSRQAPGIFVRRDAKLARLASIAFSECAETAIARLRNGS